MTTQTAHIAAPLKPLRRGRTAAAVAAAVVANAVLAPATDQLFHVLEVYPPWGQAMPDAGDNLLALGYRLAYGVLGGYIAARLARQDAPGSPMRAALAFGVVGLLNLAGGVGGALWAVKRLQARRVMDDSSSELSRSMAALTHSAPPDSMNTLRGANSEIFKEPPNGR